MLRTALVENVLQLEHVGRKAANEVAQYSDVVTDLTTDKALLLVNRRLAKAEEHNRQLMAQLRAKNEALADQAKLNEELQGLLRIKEDRLQGALAAQGALEAAAAAARQERAEALAQLEAFEEQHTELPQVLGAVREMETRVEAAESRAEALQAEAEAASGAAEKAARRQAELASSNAELRHAADIAHQTLNGEKEINAKLKEANAELLSEYKLLEESRNRCVEIIKMYKGQVGNLSERVEDLVMETSSKSVYLARHAARIEQLSSVVATQSQHHLHGMKTPSHQGGKTPVQRSVDGLAPMPSARNVGSVGPSKPSTARHQEGRSAGPLAAQSSVQSGVMEAGDAQSSSPQHHSRQLGPPSYGDDRDLHPSLADGQGQGMQWRLPSGTGHAQLPTPFAQQGYGAQPPEQSAAGGSSSRKPGVGHAHHMAGKLPSQLPPRIAPLPSQPPARKMPKGTPGLAEAVNVPAHQRPHPHAQPQQQQQQQRGGQHPLPPGHSEWEAALVAGVAEHQAALAAQQEAAWLAQGKHNNQARRQNPLLPRSGMHQPAADQQQRYQKAAAGYPARSKPGVAQRPGHHQPGMQCNTYDQGTGRRHLVQAQVMQ
eukprot:jgi/Tetstr1/432346/TSEL_021743.t1